MVRIAVRMSGGSEYQASITLANSSVIVPLPVSGAASGAAPSAKRPFSSGFRGHGSGLQIRHPGFESRRRLSSHPVASCGTRASNACDSLDLGSSAFFVAHCGWSHPVAGKSGVSRPARSPLRLPFSNPPPCPAVRVHSSDLAVTAGELNAGAGAFHPKILFSSKTVSAYGAKR